MTEPTAISRLPDGGRFVALDSWRGIAALGVVFLHIGAEDGLAATAWHDRLGLMGDFFFVLSGFVITGAYGERLANGYSLAKFMWLRLGRIYPLYLAMVLIYLALEIGFALTLEQGSGARIPFTGRRDPSDLPAVLLLVQAFTHADHYIWHTPSWSISVELWLYLIAAAGWHLLGRRAAWVGLALALVALACFFNPGPLVERWDSALRGVAGFGLGMALWEIHRRFGDWSALPRGAATASETGVVVVAAALLVNPYAQGLFTPACGLVVFIFARERGLISRFLRMSPFVFLGTISYALYMTHGLVLGRIYDVIVLAERFLGLDLVAGGLLTPVLLNGPAFQANLLVLVMLLATVPPAWIAWRWLEYPAREWSRRRAARWGAGEAERAAPTF